MAVEISPEEAAQNVREKQDRFQASARLSLEEARRARADLRTSLAERNVTRTPEYQKQWAQLNPETKLYGNDYYRELFAENDREAIAATLRAQAAAAEKRIQEKKAAGGRYRDYKEYDKIKARSTAAASAILSKSGDITLSERKLVGRARYPDKSSTEIERKFYAFGSPERSRAVAAEREYEQAVKRKEAAGFIGSTNDFLKQEKPAGGQQIYEVTTPEGRTFRSSNPDWVKERFGVDPRKQANNQLTLVEEGTGKRFDSRIQEINGRKVVLGVRSVPEGERYADRVQLNVSSTARSQNLSPPTRQSGTPPIQAPPEAQLAADLTTLRDGNVSVLPPGVESTTQFNLPPGPPPQLMLRENKPVPLFSAPEGYEFDESQTKRLGPFVFTTERAGDLIAQGKANVAKGRRAFSEGDLLEGARLTIKGGTEQFAGGSRRFFGFVRDDPALAAATAGAYAGATALAGPAGAATLFAAQNTAEFAAGQEPSVVRMAREPIVAAGELAPGAAAFGAGSFGLRSVRASRSSTYNAQFEGQFLTPAAQRALALQERGLSTEIQVTPLEAIQLSSTQLSRAPGAQLTAARARPVYGDDLILTSQELAQAPTNFKFTIDSQTTAGVRAQAGSPGVEVNPFFEKVPGGFVEGARITPGAELGPGVRFSQFSDRQSGLIRSEQLGPFVEPRAGLDIRGSSLDPGLQSITQRTGRISFEPIELSSRTDLAVKNVAQGANKGASRERIGPGGSTLEYRPSLDFFQEMLRVQKGGQELVLRESFATGKPEVSVTPLVIRSVSTKAQPGLGPVAPRVKVETPAAKDQGSSAGGITIREVEIDRPQEDGTVLKQKQKIIEISDEALKTEQTSLSKTEQKQEQKTKTKEKAKAKQKKKLGVLQVKKVTVKAQASVKVKPTTVSKSSQKVSVGAAVTQLQGQAAGQKLSSSQLSAQKPAQDLAQAQRQAQTPKSLQLPATITATASATDTLTKQKQILDQVPRLVTPGRPRRPGTPLVPETPKIFKPLKLKPDEDKKDLGDFRVQVKTKGRFKDVGVAETAAQAFEKGKDIAKSSAAASVRVRSPKGELVKPSAGVFGLFFRTGKKDKFTLVEKSKYRIDTPGERLEITAKGISTPKRKKKRRGGGILGFFR